MTRPPVVVGLGEVLWDIFPDHKRPGGAPCNVAYHAAALGNRGVIASRIGRDALGTELKALLDARGVDTSYLQLDSDHPTGTVEVHIHDGEPSYTIVPEVAWDYLVFDEELARLAETVDAVCFSTLAQRNAVSRHSLRQFLQRVPSSALRVLDINLRPPYYDADTLEASIRLADGVKMNRDEHGRLQQLFDRNDVVDWLLHERGMRFVCVTKGRNGSDLFTPGACATVEGLSVDTSEGDAVGVGDAFVAVLIHHLLRAAPPQKALDAATRYAAFVATQRGGMPTVPAALLRAVG